MVIVLCSAMAGCEREDENEVWITFDEECDMAPIFPSEGDTIMYGFEARTSWSVEVHDDWVTVFPESGTAESRYFSLMVAPTESIEPRSSSITIHMARGKSVTIPIKQERKPYMEHYGGEVYTVGAEGGTLDIDIAVNMEYEVYIPKTNIWLRADRRRGMQESTIRVNFDKSSLDVSRMEYIRVLTLDGRTIDSMLLIQDAYTSSLNEISYTTSHDSIAEIKDFALYENDIVAHIYDDRHDRCRMVFETPVKYLPEEAFKECSDITSLELPVTIMRIGDRAFAGCSGCDSFVIPKGVTTIGSAIFEGCSGELTMLCEAPNSPSSSSDAEHWLYGSTFSTVTLNNGVGKSAFRDYSPLRTVIFDKEAHNVQNNAFSGCSNVESVYISDMEHWYQMSFNSATANPLQIGTAKLYANNEEVTEAVTSEETIFVGRYVFYNYAPLKSITINDTTKSIGWGAFSMCNVEEIYLGESISSMGVGVFEECNAQKLTIGFNFPGHDYSVTNSMHWFKGLKCEHIAFSDKVTSIGNFTLSGLPVVHITVGDNVKYIGKGAFARCDKLESVTLGSGVKLIDQHALYECSALSDIDLPEGVTTIEAYAFNSCTALESITIPSTVTFIGEYAFSNCDKLLNIYMHSTVPPQLDNRYIFSNESDGLTIYVPTEAYEAYIEAETWSHYASIIKPYTTE